MTFIFSCSMRFIFYLFLFFFLTTLFICGIARTLVYYSVVLNCVGIVKTI
nr:MAG TPA: hypothetical protein [Bacteriophage sp.]